MITSVNIAEWGPCCSTAPTGMITVEDFFNQLSSSLFVSSPRNTVGAFMTENRSHPMERAPAESLGNAAALEGHRARFPSPERNPPAQHHPLLRAIGGRGHVPSRLI